MDKKWKKALQASYEPPKPIKKEEFLQNLTIPKIRYREFFIRQFAYIQKRIWCLFALLVFVLLTKPVAQYLSIEFGEKPSAIWFISAILPLVALLTIVEIMRSVSFNMLELEMSCKYSFSSVIMARTTILGIVNLSLFIAILAIIRKMTPYSLLRTSVYLLLPYLITCALSLFLLNRVRGRESIYYCAALAIAVSVMDGILSNTKQILYNKEFVFVWVILCVCCVVIIGRQGNKFIRITEDGKWNLLLTD